MDTINNKHATIYASIFLVIILSIFFVFGVDNDQLRLLLGIGFLADILVLVSSIVRWIKYGEISNFYSNHEDE